MIFFFGHLIFSFTLTVLQCLYESSESTQCSINTGDFAVYCMGINLYAQLVK